jgi:hypothetical protein
MTPPCAETRKPFTNLPPTGSGVPEWAARFFQASVTSEGTKEMDRLRRVEEAAGLLDDLDFSVDDLIESRKEAARHGG